MYCNGTNFDTYLKDYPDGFNAWMKDYALPEHLLQWPFLMCPILAAAQAGLGLLIDIFW